MPYSGQDDKSLPANVQKMPAAKRRQWVEVFNSAFEKCETDNGDDCEGAAFRQANAVIAEERMNDKDKLPELTEDTTSIAGDNTEFKTSEMYGDEPADVYIPFGITSFADLDAATEAEESLQEVQDRTYQLQNLVFSVIGNPEIDNKAVAIRSITEEYLALIEDILAGGAQAAEVEQESADFAEFDTRLDVDVVGLSEGEGDDGKVTYIDFVPIRPGWGNKKDNHYYPEHVVNEAMPVWEGGKMYATDHRQEQKSVLTEVSQVIKSPAGITEDGVPYARAVIVNPTFEAIAKKRHAAGILPDLHCSILASGRAKPGFEKDGRKGKLVEAITEGSIDWVTRAGAGGHALNILSESEVGVSDKDKHEQELEEAEGEDVILHEGEQEAETAEPAECEPCQETESEADEFLSEADVEALLPEHLPQLAKDKIKARQFASETDAKHVIAVEVEYIKALTNSGLPVGGQTTKQAPAKASLEELTAQKDAINKKYFGG